MSNALELEFAGHPALDCSKAALSDLITLTLSGLGLHPQVMAFSSLLGQGINVFVDIKQDGAEPMRLIGAHYDGSELYDNIGGVLSVLDAVTHLLEIKTRHAWRIAFWDGEEKFQQGSRSYVKHLLSNVDGERLRITERHPVYVDFDGIGLGTSVFARSVSKSSSQIQRTGSHEHNFLMDCDVFHACGIPSFHIFSGPHQYENIYKESGLDGCHRLIQVQTLGTGQNFRESMTSSVAALRRLVTAWEGMPFATALTEAGITWLR